MRVDELDIKNLPESVKAPLLNSVHHDLQKYFTDLGIREAGKLAKPLLFAALEEGKLAGFALLVYRPAMHLADLSQLHVFEMGTIAKVAPLLLQAIEDRLFALGCVIVQHHYSSEENKPPDPIEEQLVLKGWGQKTKLSTRYYFDCYAFKPKWFTKIHRLPKGFSLVPWHSLRAEEKIRLRRMEEKSAFHPFISPFEDEEHIQKINSLGLLHEGEIVGWMITHTLPEEPDIIRYSSLYVAPEYLSKGPAAILLKESIDLQKRSPLRWSYFQVTWAFTDARWLRFINNRLCDETLRIVHRFRLSKGLR